MNANLTGHYLSPNRMYVYGIVGGEIFSRYQVSALMQNGKMPKLRTPGSPLGWIPSDTNDAVRWIRGLEQAGKILNVEQFKALGYSDTGEQNSEVCT